MHQHFLLSIHGLHERQQVRTQMLVLALGHKVDQRPLPHHPLLAIHPVHIDLSEHWKHLG